MPPIIGGSKRKETEKPGDVEIAVSGFGNVVTKATGEIATVLQAANGKLPQQADIFSLTGDDKGTVNGTVGNKVEFNPNAKIVVKAIT